MRSALFAWLALLLMPTAAAVAKDDAATMGWQEAVAEFAGERTRAETCVRGLKRHAGDDPAALSRGDFAYSEAKADMDAVIAALIVAVTTGETPTSVADLEARIGAAVKEREAFCAAVRSLVPDDSGTKGSWGDLVGGAVGSMVEAGKDIYIQFRKEELLVRETIRTQLEATRWPAFPDVRP